MNLQWQRQIECWLRLMGRRDVVASIQINLTDKSDNVFIEQLNGRAVISRTRAVSERDAQATLLRLLPFLIPDASQGVPMRIFYSQGQICLTACAPETSGAELWQSISLHQAALLNRCIHDNPNQGR